MFRFLSGRNGAIKKDTTTRGLSWRTKPLVSRRAFSALCSLGSPMKACPFIRPSFISTTSNLRSKAEPESIVTQIWKRFKGTEEPLNLHAHTPNQWFVCSRTRIVSEKECQFENSFRDLFRYKWICWCF